MLPGIRSERGFTIVELVVVAALLGLVVGTFLFMVTTTTRGWLLLQQQLDVQQHPRVASDRLINDLQQALDDSTGGTLTVQKVSVIVCPIGATATTSTIIVDNAADIPTSTVVTLTALSTGVNATTVSAIGSTTACASTGVTGTALTITPNVTSATAPFGLPYGTLVAPIPVSYTSAGTQITRAGQALADLVTSLSFTGLSTTLSAQAPAGVSTPTVASTVGFAVGDLIFIGTEIRSISSIVGSTFNLDQGVFVTHTAGDTVRKKLVTTVIIGQTTQTLAAGSQLQTVTDTSEGVPRNPPVK